MRPLERTALKVLGPLSGNLQTLRAKLKAKGAADSAFKEKATECSTLASSLEAYMERANDVLAETELMKKDDPEDAPYVKRKAELETLCAACETHTDGARRARTRFQGLIS